MKDLSFFLKLSGKSHGRNSTKITLQLCVKDEAITRVQKEKTIRVFRNSLQLFTKTPLESVAKNTDTGEIMDIKYKLEYTAFRTKHEITRCGRNTELTLKSSFLKF